MDFSLTDTQRLLVDTVDHFLGDRYGFPARSASVASEAGWSRTVWGDLAAMGVTALPFAESDGGHGGSAVDVMLVMQAFGRALVVEPFLACVVLAGRAIEKGGNDAQRERYLRPIASGERLAAWAHCEPRSRLDPDRVDTVAKSEGTGWRLSGRKSQVLNGASADVLVVSARHGSADGALALFLVDARAAGVSVHCMRRIDGLEVAELELNDVAVPAQDALVVADALGLIHEVEDVAIAAITAETVGAMEAALRLTLEHIKVRKQFGVPLGNFQVLQHRAADMHVAIEQAKSMAMFAAMSVDSGDPARRSAGVSAAKIVVDRAARLVGDSAIQMHGAIGMTDEHAVGHYARKLAAARSTFGDVDFHARRLAKLGAVLEEAM